MLETTCSPALIPGLSADLAEFATPLTKYGVLELGEVAVLIVVRVCKAPGELAANHFGFVYVGANNGHGKERNLVRTLLLR